MATDLSPSAARNPVSVAECRSCGHVVWDRLTHDWLCASPRQPDRGRIGCDKARQDPNGCGPRAAHYQPGIEGDPMPSVCVAPELRRAALMSVQSRIAAGVWR